MDIDMRYVFRTGHDSNKFILQSKYCITLFLDQVYNTFWE